MSVDSRDSGEIDFDLWVRKFLPREISDEYSKYVTTYEEHEKTSKHGNAQNDVADTVMVLIYLQNLCSGFFSYFMRCANFREI